MNYSIMSKDLKSTFLGKEYLSNPYRTYEGYKRQALDKDSSMYGIVLVLLKQKGVGFNLKITINWHWIKYQIKPKLDWRYRKEFTWLILTISFEKEFIDLPDVIVKDFLTEETQTHA